MNGRNQTWNRWSQKPAQSFRKKSQQQKKEEKMNGNYKPKFLITVFCGAEEGIVPSQVEALLRMSTDNRFAVTIKSLVGMHHIDFARNRAMTMARDGNFDALLMFDRDQAPAADCDVLGLLWAAPGDIAAIPYAVKMPDAIGVPVVVSQPMVVSQDQAYIRVDAIATGCMLVRSTAWRTWPVGPWFAFKYADDELRSIVRGEDYNFCDSAIARGLKIWAVNKGLLGHLKSVNISGFVTRNPPPQAMPAPPPMPMRPTFPGCL